MNPQQPPPNMQPLVPSRRQRRLNRRQKAYMLPQSTDTVLIFPCVGKPMHFYRGEYNPSLTDGRLGMDEFNRFFDTIDPIVQAELSGIAMVRPVFISVVVVALMLMIAYYVAFGDEWSQYIIALVAFIVFVIIMSVFMVKYTRNKLVKTISRIQPHLDAANQSLSPVGLTWMLPSSFPKWISLRKDYKIDGIPIGMLNNPYPDQGMPVPQPVFNQPAYYNPPYPNYYGGPQGPGGPNDVPQGQYPQNYYPNYQQNNNGAYYPPQQP